MARKFTEFRVDRGPEHLTLPLRINDSGDEFSTTLFDVEIKGATARSVREEAQRRYTGALEATWDAYYKVTNQGHRIEAIELTREPIVFAPPAVAHPQRETPKGPRKVRLFRVAQVDDDGRITPQFSAEAREANFAPNDTKLIPVTPENHAALFNMVERIEDIGGRIEALRARRDFIVADFFDRFGQHSGYVAGGGTKAVHPQRPSGFIASADVADIANRVTHTLDATFAALPESTQVKS